MVCVTWLLMTVGVFALRPGVRALGWDTSLYDDLSSEDRRLDCIHLWKSLFQAKLPDLSSSAQQSNEDNLSLDVLLANLANRERILERKPKKLNERRRSYSMEHFRWGKPAGRKRRPIKVYPSTLEGGDSPEGSFLQQARRQLRTTNRGQRGLDPQRVDNQEGAQAWGRFGPKLVSLLVPQEKKDGTYRMGHFRWGRPPAVKRYGGLMKPLAQQPQKPLLKLLRNVIVKDAK